MKCVEVSSTNKENYITLVDDDDDEDNVSYQHHIKVMTAEYKRVNQMNPLLMN